MSYTVVISLNPDDKFDEKDSYSPDGKTQQESHPFFFIKVWRDSMFSQPIIQSVSFW